MKSSSVIYEMNVRQQTPEGTFGAAMLELPRLSALGIDVLWLMPIQPIGRMNRKGTLGSYYAVSDYEALNAEYGKADDFEAFVEEAHRLGMVVLMDWVANHTAPDHVWTRHAGWHRREDDGRLAVQYDWTDISALNYDSKPMREAMIAAMRYWVDRFGVDGFRCDMAMLVPIDFWREAIGALRRHQPNLFFLAEAEDPELLQAGLFEAFYTWKQHHTLNDIAQGKQAANALWGVMDDYRDRFPRAAYRLSFTSNHDENSHSGSEFERLGDAMETLATLNFILPSWPLLYTGQELGNRKRLKFFDKDVVEPQDPEQWMSFYQERIGWRRKYDCLRSGAEGAPLEGVANDAFEQIFSFKRIGEKETLFAFFNLSAHPRAYGVFDENFEQTEVYDIEDPSQRMPLPKHGFLCPWAYKIYISPTAKKSGKIRRPY